MAEKKPAPKPKAKKETKPKAPIVELVSYSIKMTIPTGQYANVQPEIIVKAGNVKDAHDYIAPHMNKLWKEYYLINERRPEIHIEAPAPVVEVKPVVENKPDPAVRPDIVSETQPVVEVPPSPDSSVAFKKATQAINSCLSVDAYNLIVDQLGISTKLTKEDKDKLVILAQAKFDEIVAKA